MEISLERWALISREGSVCLQGLLIKKGRKKEVWETTEVVKRINATTVCTKNGTTYKLCGPMLQVKDNPFPKDVLKKFKDGFPFHWKHLLKNSLYPQKTTEDEGQTDADTQLSLNSERGASCFSRYGRPLKFRSNSLAENKAQNKNSTAACNSRKVSLPKSSAFSKENMQVFPATAKRIRSHSEVKQSKHVQCVDILTKPFLKNMNGQNRSDLDLNDNHTFGNKSVLSELTNLPSRKVSGNCPLLRNTFFEQRGVTIRSKRKALTNSKVQDDNGLISMTENASVHCDHPGEDLDSDTTDDVFSDSPSSLIVAECSVVLEELPKNIVKKYTKSPSESSKSSTETPPTVQNGRDLKLSDKIASKSALCQAKSKDCNKVDEERQTNEKGGQTSRCTGGGCRRKGFLLPKTTLKKQRDLRAERQKLLQELPSTSAICGNKQANAFQKMLLAAQNSFSPLAAPPTPTQGPISPGLFNPKTPEFNSSISPSNFTAMSREDCHRYFQRKKKWLKERKATPQQANKSSPPLSERVTINDLRKALFDLEKKTCTDSDKENDSDEEKDYYFESESD